MFDEIFANELKAALDFVNSDIDKDLYDSVDEKVKRQTVKKRRLCEKGHINEVRDNRKICDRNFCKALLQRIKVKPFGIEDVDEPLDDIEREKDIHSKEQVRAFNHLNLKNIDLGLQPIELAVGALPINPNTPERIMKVLDKILEAARMKNIFVVKLVLCKDSVKRVFIDHPEVRNI